MSDDDDDLILDDEPGETKEAAGPPWFVLVVDDEPDIHTGTGYAIANEVIYGRPIQLLHAYSRAEAVELFKKHKEDIVLALIDVVMESADAGLLLTEDIRNLPAGRDVRLILRTGQPGNAFEGNLAAEYNINGYLSKSQLTKKSLMMALALALRDRQTIRELLDQLEAARGAKLKIE